MGIPVCNLPSRYVAIILAYFSLSSCSTPDTYSVELNVVSTLGYGVVLYDFPFSKKNLKSYYRNLDLKRPEHIQITPNVPGEWEGIVVTPPFAGYESSELPDRIAIKYQYAELAGCGIDRQEYAVETDPVTGVRTELSNGPKYYTKRRCDEWKLLPDKVFTEEIDLTPFKNSEEMKLLGKRNESGHGIGTIVQLNFLDDGTVSVKLSNIAHNPWK